MFKNKNKKDLITDIVFFNVLIGVLIGTNIFLKPISISGASMNNTLFNGAFGYSVKTKEDEEFYRGEIVIIKMNDDNGKEKYIVKRIIGLPGEIVSCKNGNVYINGVELDEDTYALGNTENIGTVLLGDDEYFVLGDNREHSSDSRVYGTFKSEQFVSKHMFIINSVTRFGYHE